MINKSMEKKVKLLFFLLAVGAAGYFMYLNGTFG